MRKYQTESTSFLGKSAKSGMGHMYCYLLRCLVLASSFSAMGLIKKPLKATELKRFIVIESLWNKYLVSLGSPVTSER